jgi:hypothetical protein
MATRSSTIIRRVSGTASPARNALAALSAPLLAPSATAGAIAACIAALEAFLERHAPFRRAEAIAEGESPLPAGWAVSPTQAVMCARDYLRTHAFARGLALAVADIRARHPHRRARVLYAGCGPWALLALPVLASKPGDAAFTLLDVHQTSTDSAGALVTNAGLAADVQAIVCADAATWTVPQEDLAPDIILSETLNAGLRREPFVAIAQNLLRQAPSAILIPASVRVDAVLVDPAREHQSRPLGTVFEVTREAIAGWPRNEPELPAATITLPAAFEPALEPRLFTTLETYGGERLETDDSWLTRPEPFPPGAFARRGERIEFVYRLGPEPRISVKGHTLPDRLRLPMAFDPRKLDAALDALEGTAWTDHFVTRNYEGRWSAIALRAPKGTETQHPVLQLASHPGVTAYADTPALDAAPYFRDVLFALGFPVASARLMCLDPGSAILPHRDADLAVDHGWARLHIPVRTNPQVEFLLNGAPVVMRPGECWYLRLSDLHSVRNGGETPRVHLVIDAPVGRQLRQRLERAHARQMAASQTL